MFELKQQKRGNVIVIVDGAIVGNFPTVHLALEGVCNYCAYKNIYNYTIKVRRHEDL